MLTDVVLQDWGIPELEIQEVMAFKKWYMLWKFSDESVTLEMIDIFTKEPWEDCINKSLMEETINTQTPQASTTIPSTPSP